MRPLALLDILDLWVTLYPCAARGEMSVVPLAPIYWHLLVQGTLYGKRGSYALSN